MEVTLVVVTLVSLALAMAMGVITWRLLQEDRQRSDARVAVLEQGLAASPIAPATGPTPTDELFAVPDLDADGDVADTRGGLFQQAAAPDDDDGGLSRRVVAIAAVAAVMVGAVLAFWTVSRLVAPAAPPQATEAAPAALELVALRHAQQDGTLTINGLVRNPRQGSPQERLTAVVFFFDGKGGFLSSTRAPLDFRALAPGDESPFQLSAPVPPGVARFRVSFRHEEGGIVPHVDRRQQEAS